MNSKIDGIEIVEPTKADVLGMRKMHAQSWRDVYPNESAGVSEEWVADRTGSWFAAESMAKSYERMDVLSNDDNHLELVAKTKESDTVVGIAHGSKEGGEQRIEALYVDSSFYGTGLAQKLTEALMKWFDLSKQVTLEVASYNDRAIRFYGKYGFKVVEGSEHKFGDVMPVIYMVRGGNNEV